MIEKLAGNNSIPNHGPGIFVNTSNATIGGSAGTGNVIAFNQGAGVATPPGTTGTTIRFNAIFSNAGPGIDLNNDGVTPNTPGGTNNTPADASVAGGTISGTLSAAPHGTYILDFYASSASDASAARPQGRDYLTSMTIQTNAAGDAVFNVSYTPFPGLPIFTATATAADGTTSEFSPPVSWRAADEPPRQCGVESQPPVRASQIVESPGSFRIRPCPRQSAAGP